MEKMTAKLTDVFTNFWMSTLEVLPDLTMAIVVFTMFWFATKGVRWGVKRLAKKADADQNIQNLVVTASGAITLGVGTFASAAILFPGLSAGDLVSVLGLSGVAIGFAFKDIFQNFLAGILILSRRPFKIGDFIKTSDLSGFVEDISFRNTIMRTVEGEELIVPNSEIFTNPVRVQTARDQLRDSFRTGVSYDTDLDQARQVLMEAVQSADGVAEDPAPRVLVEAHDASSVNFHVMYWTSSQPADVWTARDSVATKTKEALDEAGIEIPFPQNVLHFANPEVLESAIEVRDAA